MEPELAPTANHPLRFTVEIGELPFNPVAAVQTGREQGNPEIDPRVVVNPRQARQLLAAVSYVGRWHRDATLRKTTSYDYLVAFFATMYYGGLRPAEVNRLLVTDCKLSDSGWGELLLERSAVRSNARYVDACTVWETRPAQTAARRRSPRRTDPAPARRDPSRSPVSIRHDGGRPPVPRREGRRTDQSHCLHRRVEAGPHHRPGPRTSFVSLARRPYDLRHAAVSTWLAAGVHLAEVAARAGHTVDAYSKAYAKVLDGQRDLQHRIDDILR